jgi:hypothetical protein
MELWRIKPSTVPVGSELLRPRSLPESKPSGCAGKSKGWSLHWPGCTPDIMFMFEMRLWLPATHNEGTVGGRAAGMIEQHSTQSASSLESAKPSQIQSSRTITNLSGTSRLAAELLLKCWWLADGPMHMICLQ